MSKWIDIGSQDQFAQGSSACITVEDESVVICNVDGQLAAVLNVCPHAHLPIGEGELRGSILVCPFHGYAYNVLTGRNADFPNEELPATTFPIRVTEAGHVEIDIANPSDHRLKTSDS